MTQPDNSLSFYFFDFDDNIMFLQTPVLIRNRQTKEPKEISTTEFATIRSQLGQPGPWADYEVYSDTYKS